MASKFSLSTDQVPELPNKQGNNREALEHDAKALARPLKVAVTLSETEPYHPTTTLGVSSHRRSAIPAMGMVNFGDLGGLEPISRAFGGDRGKPLDRYYIESFLEQHASDIRGRVAEIGDNFYTHRFGREGVARSDIVDSPESANPSATMLVDLQNEIEVEASCLDCLIITQTLHMIYDVRGALATIHRALAPGGVVLATVPGITSIDVHDGPEKWFWSMTQTAARRLFEERFGKAGVEIEQFGNVLAATAFLQGIAFEEIDRESLDVVDPLYPVITAIRATKS